MPVIVAERQHVLDQSLSVGRLAEDGGAVVILQRAASRFRLRSRCGRPPAPPSETCRESRYRALALLLFLIAAAIVKINCFGLQKQRRDFHRRLHRAAGIVAQVQDQSLEIRAAQSYR